MQTSYHIENKLEFLNKLKNTRPLHRHNYAGMAA